VSASVGLSASAYGDGQTWEGDFNKDPTGIDGIMYDPPENMHFWCIWGWCHTIPDDILRSVTRGTFQA